MLKILKTLYQLIYIIILIVLLGIHFVVKDSTFYASLLFYTFPLPIIILIALVLSVFLGKRMRRYNFILIGLLLMIWLGRSFKIHSDEAIKATDLEIVFWNASRDRGFEDAFIVNDGVPDVLVLSERNKTTKEFFQLQHPHYFYRSFRELSVFSKTPLQIENEIPSKYGSAIIHFKTAGINFYAVDISGSIDVPRTWELDFIMPLIKERAHTVVLGDFNVPFESLLLKDLKQNFNHAFSKKGTGFRETWFWNLPLLSLDHIWVSRDLKILKTKKTNTFKSDHSMIQTVIEN